MCRRILAAGIAAGLVLITQHAASSPDRGALSDVKGPVNADAVLYVQVVIAGGEPGSVVESIAARREGDAVSVEVVRESWAGEREVLRKSILAVLARRVTDLVLSHNLWKFTPVTRYESVADYGGQRLRVEWRDGSTVRELDESWSAPLAKPDSVQELAAALAALASDAMPGVRLSYFPQLKQ